MATGQIVAAVIIVVAVYLLSTIVLPALLVAVFNLALIALAGRQALLRWKTQTHYWYEMGAIFRFLITMFY